MNLNIENNMISYTLAKELKDAGFPHDWHPIDGVSDEVGEKMWNVYKDKYSPTLSELIEACVDLEENGDFHLEAWKGQFRAGICRLDEWFDGKTAEEAASRLWLALNNK